MFYLNQRMIYEVDLDNRIEIDANSSNQYPFRKNIRVSDFQGWQCYRNYRDFYAGTVRMKNGDTDVSLRNYLL